MHLGGAKRSLGDELAAEASVGLAPGGWADEEGDLIDVTADTGDWSEFVMHSYRIRTDVLKASLRVHLVLLKSKTCTILMGGATCWILQEINRPPHHHHRSICLTSPHSLLRLASPQRLKPHLFQEPERPSRRHLPLHPGARLRHLRPLWLLLLKLYQSQAPPQFFVKQKLTAGTMEKTRGKLMTVGNLRRRLRPPPQCLP